LKPNSVNIDTGKTKRLLPVPGNVPVAASQICDLRILLSMF